MDHYQNFPSQYNLEFDRSNIERQLESHRKTFSSCIKNIAVYMPSLGFTKAKKCFLLAYTVTIFCHVMYYVTLFTLEQYQCHIVAILFLNSQN